MAISEAAPKPRNVHVRRVNRHGVLQPPHVVVGHSSLQGNLRIALNGIMAEVERGEIGLAATVHDPDDLPTAEGEMPEPTRAGYLHLTPEWAALGALGIAEMGGGAIGEVKDVLLSHAAALAVVVAPLFAERSPELARTLNSLVPELSSSGATQ